VFVLRYKSRGRGHVPELRQGVGSGVIQAMGSPMTDPEWLDQLANELDQAVRMTITIPQVNQTVEGAQYLRFNNQTAYEMADRLRQIAERIATYEEWTKEVHRDD
jgi:hypothetical protein